MPVAHGSATATSPHAVAAKPRRRNHPAASPAARAAVAAAHSSPGEIHRPLRCEQDRLGGRDRGRVGRVGGELRDRQVARVVQQARQPGRGQQPAAEQRRKRPVRQAVADAAARVRAELAALAALAARAEEHLADPASLLPHRATVGARRLRMRRLHVAHPAELAEVCAHNPSPLLLTWLRGRPAGGFSAALAVPWGGERLILPERDVVRTMVPPGVSVVEAGQDMFGWLGRRRLAVTGPTLEEYLVDGEGAAATVLEIPVAPG